MPRHTGSVALGRLLARLDEQHGRSVCWNWPLAVKRSGYGQAKVGGRCLLAHRAAYIALRGAIPEGLQIDHLCRNKRCVNPWHLEPVTPRENLIRGNPTIAANATKTHCAHGHAFDESNTYFARGTYGPERMCRTCCRTRARARREAKRAHLHVDG